MTGPRDAAICSTSSGSFRRCRCSARWSCCSSASASASRSPGWIATGLVGARVRLVGRDVLRHARPPERDARVNIVTSYTWLPAGALHVNMGFFADPLSITWILLVTGVGSLIHLYSIGYMHGDPRFSRFFAYLNLFAVLDADARARLELPRHLPRLGGRRALLVPAHLVLVRAQRRGGRGQEGVRHQPRRRRRVPARDVPDLRVVRVARLLGDRRRARTRIVERHRHRDRAAAPRRPRSGKSAQFPLHLWLPDAMEGPTPVSALIHAATMVTAGVFLLCRAHVFLDASSDAMTVVAWVGGITALLAGTVAILQPDIKRVLAYSTISQLGYMFLAVGIGAYTAAVFIVLCTRSTRAACSSAPARSSTATTTTRTCGSWAASASSCRTPRARWSSPGSPSPACRRSRASSPKDEIISQAYLRDDYGLWIVGIVAAAFTGVYMTRLIFLTFFGNERFRRRRRSADVAGGSDDGRRRRHACDERRPTTTSPTATRRPRSPTATRSPVPSGHAPHESPSIMVVAGRSCSRSWPRSAGSSNLPFTNFEWLDTVARPVVPRRPRGPGRHRSSAASASRCVAFAIALVRHRARVLAVPARPAGRRDRDPLERTARPGRAGARATPTTTTTASRSWSAARAARSPAGSTASSTPRSSTAR